ncbi:hypothetical protein L596_000795 [Steinernema carpocapsae]|uniref:Uncharacterized protein n=1 Tax=Steinernema carpocapsae TaxID=34508 RepID=A0A4U8UJY0_STECR|nr:hypothetical protein L596_000795 [Steinernema carpocapsae]
MTPAIKVEKVLKRIVGLPVDTIYNDIKGKMEKVPEYCVYVMGDDRQNSEGSHHHEPDLTPLPDRNRGEHSITRNL